MRFIPRLKKVSASAARTMWPLSSVTNAEKLRNHYRPRDIVASESLQRSIGVVHDCAATNASVCAQQPLRLVRRVDASDASERRTYAGKKLNRATLGYMKSGVAGIKAGTFADAGGEVQEVVDHPILDLLARPNPDYPGMQLSWLSFYYREITGKAYEMVGIGDDGTPSSLFPMPSQFVTILMDDEGIAGYRYARGDATVADLLPEDVIYYRHRPSRFNPFDGEGPLVGVLAEADLLLSNLTHDLASVRNGNRFDSVIGVNDPMITSDQLDEFEARTIAKHSGAMRAGGSLFTRGNVTVQPLSWPEKELQSLAKQELYEKRIRSAFGHTESMADSNASTYASALVGYDHQYMGAAIRPRLLMDAAQKTEFLCPMFGLDPTVYMFVYDDPVMKDETAVREQTRQDVSMGIISINEARGERGMDESDEEGADVLRVNGQKFDTLDSGGGFDLFGGGGITSPRPAQSEDEDTEEVPEVMGQKIEETALNGAQIAQLTDLASKVSLGELTRAAARNIASAAFPGIPDDKIDGIFNELVEGGASDGDGEGGAKRKKSVATAHIFKGMMDDELPEWTNCGCSTKDDDDIANEPLIEQVYRDYLRKVEATFEDVVTDMQDEVIGAVREGRPSNLEPLKDQAAGVLSTEMRRIIDDGVRFTLEAANEDIDSMFDVAQTSALEFLDRHVIQVADDIAETTDTMIRPAIQRGLDQGLSIDQIASDMEGLPKYRAERIARTEVQTAAQGSRYETFKEIGVEEVEWVTAPGASKAHQEIAARGRRKVGEPFVKAGETIGKEKFTRDIYYPPARPNCRCSIRSIYDTSGGDE